MVDEARWRTLGRVANVVGVLMAIAALGIIARFAMLLTQAWQGHPRLIG
jgi:hypothetical protein